MSITTTSHDLILLIRRTYHEKTSSPYQKNQMQNSLLESSVINHSSSVLPRPLWCIYCMIHEYEAMGNLKLMVFEKFKCNFIKGLAPVHCVVYRLALSYKTQHTDGGERTVFLCVKQSINNVVSKKLNGFSASSSQLASSPSRSDTRALLMSSSS